MKKQLLYTISMMVLITVVGLALNLIALFPSYSTNTLFSARDVKAITLQYPTKPINLDIKTQKELLGLLNQGEITTSLDMDKIQKNQLIDVEKVIVYRFDHPKIDLVPLGLLDDKMVFHMVGLGEACFVLKKDPQELTQLISQE